MYGTSGYLALDESSMKPRTFKESLWMMQMRKIVRHTDERGCTISREPGQGWLREDPRGNTTRQRWQWGQLDSLAAVWAAEKPTSLTLNCPHSVAHPVLALCTRKHLFNLTNSHCAAPLSAKSKLFFQFLTVPNSITLWIIQIIYKYIF